MDLSNRAVLVRSTLTLEDIASPTGFILNKGDPKECYVVFPESGYIPEILKLIEDPQWVGRHMHLTLDRPSKGILSIVAKLLGDQTLEEGGV